MLAQRLKVLAACIGALVLLLAAGIYLGSSRVVYDLKRSEIARQELETFLLLSDLVYRHFRLESDILLGRGPGADPLASRLKIDETIEYLKALTREETVFIVDHEERVWEAGEFDRVASLEAELQGAYRRLEEISKLFNPRDERQGREALFAFLQETIEGRLNVMISAAIEDEASEVLIADEKAQRLLERLSLAAQITATVALAATLLLFIVFSRRIGRPITRLLQGIEKVAAGDLDHRIVVPGGSELAAMASNFNTMVSKLKDREAALRSARADLEMRVKDRTQQLDAANNALKRTDQLRQRFLADISHELRTPITVIQGEAEVALRGKDKELSEYKRALKHITDSSNQLGRLVSDLLFMARTSAGEVYISLKPVELTTLLDAIREDAGMLGRHKSVKIALRRVEGEVAVLGDRDRLRQLFLILIENAIRYSGNDVDIALDVTRSADRVRTRVTDNGFGMSQTEIDNAFDRFYRGDNGSRAFSEGSGLGLPVAKSIVQAHKGEIAIESTPGEGTAIILDLPAAQKIRPAA